MKDHVDCENCPYNNNVEWDVWSCPLKDVVLCPAEENGEEE